MSEARTAAHDHASNGHRKEGLGGARNEPDGQSAAGVGGLPRIAGRLLKGLADNVSKRIPVADLDERDPDYIRENLPGLWLLSSLYFRGEVRGLGNIPEDGPVLLVGNHSGGNL